MSVEHFDLLVIGGGVVGLATAREALARGRNVVLIEKEDGVAAHQTGHNSGVIHSGVYYKPGSLKAELCVRGAGLMKAFCEEWSVPRQQVGKLIVAKNGAEVVRLEVFHQRGRANQVGPIELYSSEQVREIAPSIFASSALWLPEVCITDYSQVALRLADSIEGEGGTILLRTEALSICSTDSGVVVETSRGTLRAANCINCAGLHSDRVSKIGGAKPNLQIVPFRGEYYLLQPEAAAQVPCLVYPVPDERFPFLGVHLTPMVDGRVEAGPNAVPALAREGYGWRQVNPRDLAETLMWPGFWRFVAKHWRMGVGEIARSLSKSRYLRSLQELMPSLTLADLSKGGAGVRAQAMQRDGGLVDDFRFVREGRILNVLNAPSPAATASLAIAEKIADELGYKASVTA